jgi:hypothetical protein
MTGATETAERNARVLAVLSGRVADALNELLSAEFACGLATGQCAPDDSWRAAVAARDAAHGRYLDALAEAVS